MKTYLEHNPITNDGIGGIEYLIHGIGHLISLIDKIVEKHKGWDAVAQTRGGIGPRLEFFAMNFI